MPREKIKKIKEKSLANTEDPNVSNPLIRIKFNLSVDNLKPFIEGSRSTRSLIKKMQLKLTPAQKQKNIVKKDQQKQIDTIAQSKCLRLERRSSDVSSQLSNQILYKIETMGIRFAWKDIEDSRSEDLDIGKPQSNQIKNENYDVWRYYQYSDYDKNQSFASTVDPYSNYYPNPYNCDYMNYSYQKIQYQPNDFLIVPNNIPFDERTTIMIKNIPNKYTIQFLSDEIDRDHANTYDFLYLPCDIKNNCNVGYGFINFLNTSFLSDFYVKFHKKRWGKFRSQKICQLTYARLQGLSNLIEHFQNSKVLNSKDKKYQPIIREFQKIDNLIQEQKSQSYKS